MDIREYNLDDLAAASSRKLVQSRRVSFLVSTVLVVISTAWLMFVVGKVQLLEEESLRLETVNKQLDSTITEKKRIEQYYDNLDRLWGYGFLASNFDSLFLGKDLKSQSDSIFAYYFEADSLRNSVAINSSPQRRKSVTVQYFPKDVDQDIVEASLKELGFKFERGVGNTSLADFSTNAIWFSRDVNPDDTKLVAYTLMRAGVEIKRIKHFVTDNRRSLIQVGTSSLPNTNALTVEDVRSMSEY